MFFAFFSVILLFVLFSLTSRRDVIGYASPKPASRAKLILEENADPKKGAGVLPEADKKEAQINNQILMMKAGAGTDAKNKQMGDKGAATPNKKNVHDAGVVGQEEDADTLDEPYDAAKALTEIRSLAPMIVFSKTYCGFSQRIKKLLKENYSITPPPIFVELDKHEHGPELQALIAQVTGRRLVPNVLLGASEKSRGGADDFTAWHHDGVLERKLNEWGNKKLVAKKIDPPSNL